MFSKIGKFLEVFFHSCSEFVTKKDYYISVVGLEGMGILSIKCIHCERTMDSIRIYDESVQSLALEEEFCKRYGIVKENNQYIMKK